MEPIPWTIKKTKREGDTFQSMGREMRVVRIVEQRAECNLAEVEEVGPQLNHRTGLPVEHSRLPMRYGGGRE